MDIEEGYLLVALRTVCIGRGREACVVHKRVITNTCGKQASKDDTQQLRVLLLQCATQPEQVVKGFPCALTASWASDAVDV